MPFGVIPDEVLLLLVEVLVPLQVRLLTFLAVLESELVGWSLPDGSFEFPRRHWRSSRAAACRLDLLRSAHSGRQDRTQFLRSLQSAPETCGTEGPSPWRSPLSGPQMRSGSERLQSKGTPR